MNAAVSRSSSMLLGATASSNSPTPPPNGTNTRFGTAQSSRGTGLVRSERVSASGMRKRNWESAKSSHSPRAAAREWSVTHDPLHELVRGLHAPCRLGSASR